MPFKQNGDVTPRILKLDITWRFLSSPVSISRSFNEPQTQTD
jgi:hypothetical protein